jgi:glycosyltransferase involved in cell wall biosynthesis
LELGLESNLGLQNPVTFFLHGNYDYYFELATKHRDIIDKFVCVSKPIYRHLCSILKDRKNDISANYFPVPPVNHLRKTNSILSIYYAVRNLSDEEKGFLLLPKIDALLRNASVKVNWTIIGGGADNQIIAQALKCLQNVTYYAQLDNSEVLQLVTTQDIFVLPSLHEGLPVTLVEAMKAGVVPIITNWKNATEDLVLEGENGFYKNPDDSHGYAECIITLNNNRELLQKMSERAVETANKYFDPIKNTTAIEALIIASKSGKKMKESKKVYGSRLDHPLIPNSLTVLIRRMI